MTHSEKLEMMASDYERRATAAREEVEVFRKRGSAIYVRAAQATARKYEREAASIREILQRNNEQAA